MRKKPLFLIIIILFLLAGLLAACTDTDDDQSTPTPFTTAVTTPLTTSDNPIPVPINDLAANPAFYEGAHLEITGLYRRLPGLICKGEVYRAPVRWGLVSGEFLAQASGFDQQLRQLAPEQLFMTVSGVWQKWRGPVGCGKEAVVRDVWYLATARIVSPSPLTKVTLTPGGVPIAAVSPTPETDDNPTPAVAATETAVPDPDASPTATPDNSEPIIPTVTNTPPTGASATPTSATAATATPTPVTALPSPTSGAAPTATNTPPPGASATPTGSPTPTPSPTNTPRPGTTATATAVLPLASPTPSPTTSSNPGGGATATATATPAVSPTPGTVAYTKVTMGATTSEQIQIETLGQDEEHVWQFTLDGSFQVSIYAGAEATADVELLLRNTDGTVIKQVNAAGTGEIELISKELLTTAGDYEIAVRTTAGNSADYTLLFMETEDDTDYEMVLRGAIDFGETKSDSFPENTDHLWFFYADAGDVINITVTGSDSDTDILFQLYDLTDFIDDSIPNGGSDTESLSNYTLSDTGLYVIWIGEADYEAGGYQLNLTQN